VLAGLFSRAVEHTRKELRQARAWRERGNPPGKKTDLLGDQLTWEQLLNHCQGKSKLWIITRDTDYYTNYDSEVLLNPILSQELARLHQSPPEVVCFDNLEKGLRNFAKAMRVRVKTLPAPEESRAIQEELDALPPLGWLSSTDANMAAIWDAQRRRRAAAFLATTTMQGWPPGEGMLLPLEAISTEEDVGRP
jgi:hypothetical protein